MGKFIMERISMKKRFPLAALILCLIFGMSVQVTANTLNSSWAKSYINEAYQYEIMPEEMASDDLTENITREQFCELAYKTISRISSQNKIKITYAARESHFYDTDNPSVIALKRMGVVSGRTSTKFDPIGLISREEAALILNNMVTTLGLTKFANTEGFKDKKEISSWAKESVNVVCGMNIMSGMGDGKFCPKDTYTKEQAVSTMIRLINNVPDSGSREKIDNSRYYVYNKYFMWVEDENGKVIFKLPTEKYSKVNFYSNGEKLLAFAYSDTTTDIYDIDTGRKLFTIPYKVISTSSDRYIIVGREAENIYGVYDFKGNMVAPVELSWQQLYENKYVNTTKRE